MTAIDETIKGLPPQARQEVFDFVEFLVEKYLKKQPPSSEPGKKILDYAGSWKEMGENEFQGFIHDVYERREKSSTRRQKI
jgi:hypothetical protein